MQDQPSVDAIVVGSGLNALGVVRSLGRSGLKVACISSATDTPPMLSRYVRVRAIAPNTGADLLSTLERLVVPARHRVPVFLTEEDTVQFVATRQSSLHPRAACRLPDAAVLHQLLDKASFDDFCRQHGFEVPRTLCFSHGRNVVIPGDLRYPLIIKAATKPVDYGNHFKKAYIAENAPDAAQVAAMLVEATGGAVAQEWIPGGDENIFFCLQYVGTSGPVASFVGQKLASWPPMFGGTESCTAAPERYRAWLSDLTTEFFAKAGFQGMGSMEFKVDERDGTPYLIEPTVGRTDFQEEVATVNGVNLPLAAWRYEMQLPIGEGRYHSKPRVWMDPVARPELPAATRLKRALRRLSATQAAWRWYDPGPSVGAAVSRARHSLGKRLAGRASTG